MPSRGCSKGSPRLKASDSCATWVVLAAETKGSMRSMQLRGVERAKIECARKLFNSMNEADVRYDAVDSYESLLELVR